MGDEERDPALSHALEQRLSQINGEIAELRKQQQGIIALLGENAAFCRSRLLNKVQWVELLRAGGMEEDDMLRWHRAFERRSPEAHQDFLESLGIDQDEIRQIRDQSK